MPSTAPQTQFLCPVKTCRRAFKSKTTWTTHLRAIHPFVNVQNQQDIIVTLPSSPIHRNYGPIQVSPPTSPNGHPEVEEFSGMFDLLPFFHHDLNAQLEGSSLSSSLGTESSSDHEVHIDYHPIVNGKSSAKDNYNSY
jgi:hypothetical protein